MEQTRLYYRALGEASDYVWAAPFHRLARPLEAARIALVTTASPIGLSNRDPDGAKRVWSAPVIPAPRRSTLTILRGKASTHTNDRESYRPIEVALQLSSERRFGGLTGPISRRAHRRQPPQDRAGGRP